MTVLENVMVSAAAAPPGAGTPTHLAREALAIVGLEAVESRLAATLGMRDARLLELARALASQPKLVLMDEPFAGLGQTETAEMVRRVQVLPTHGIAVLIVEHTMQAMLQLAERLIVLDRGSVLALGDPLDVVKDPRVIEAYLGETWSKDLAHA
jgi:branched-chain amino acid transport system permease protein